MSEWSWSCTRRGWGSKCSLHRTLGVQLPGRSTGPPRPPVQRFLVGRQTWWSWYIGKCTRRGNFWCYIVGHCNTEEKYIHRLLLCLLRKCVPYIVHTWAVDVSSSTARVHRTTAAVNFIFAIFLSELCEWLLSWLSGLLQLGLTVLDQPHPLFLYPVTVTRNLAQHSFPKHSQ